MLSETKEIPVSETNCDRPWLAHYEPGVPYTLEVPHITLHEFFEGVARENPGNVATIFFGARLTYGQLNDQANRFAAALQGLGVRSGDRVAIVLPNCPQFMVALFGALKAGAVAMPLNPAHVAKELHGQFSDTGVETVVTLMTLAPRVREAMVGTPVKRLIIPQMQEVSISPHGSDARSEGEGRRLGR